jgi:hypothetical protein
MIFPPGETYNILEISQRGILLSLQLPKTLQAKTNRKREEVFALKIRHNSDESRGRLVLS